MKPTIALLVLIAVAAAIIAVLAVFASCGPKQETETPSGSEICLKVSRDAPSPAVRDYFLDNCMEEMGP